MIHLARSEKEIKDGKTTPGNQPVCDAAHINQQAAVVSQQPLLHLDEVDSLVIEIQQAHAALEG